MSGWFADPEAVKRFVLGPCRCPGQPHDEDYMDIRADWSGTFTAEVETATPAARMVLFVADWNLHDESGKVAIDEEHAGRLYVDVFSRLNDWLNEHVTTATLPNMSGAPSRNGSQASASGTRTTRRRP